MKSCFSPPATVVPTEEPATPGRFKHFSVHSFDSVPFSCICACCLGFSYLKYPLCIYHLSVSISSEEDSGFSPWSPWSPCTKTCTDALSPALKSRHRQCVTPPCSGSSHQEKACNLPQCPGTPRPLSARLYLFNKSVCVASYNYNIKYKLVLS